MGCSPPGHKESDTTERLSAQSTRRLKDGHKLNNQFFFPMHVTEILERNGYNQRDLVPAIPPLRPLLSFCGTC